MGYETKPGTVLWPRQNGANQTVIEYVSQPDLSTYYTLPMLCLHKQTFLALQSIFMNWEEGGNDFSPLFDAYSEQQLHDIFSEPLLRWMKKTLAPLDKNCPSSPARAAALKTFYKWRAQITNVFQSGGREMARQASAEGSSQDGPAHRAVATVSKCASKARRRFRNGSSSNSDYTYADSRSSGSSSGSSSSSSADDDSSCYKSRVRKSRQRPRGALQEETPIGRALVDRDGNERRGRFFADIRSVVLLDSVCTHC